MRLGLKLVAANGSQAVTVLAGRTLVVGRSPACDVPIRDLTVSRHHGEVEAAASGLRVRDLGSTNGTFINGARITEGVASPGARVAFGKVIFQVMEERVEGTGHEAATADGSGDGLVVVDQMRAQAMTEIASLLAAESATAAAGRHLRVRGDAPGERRAAAASLLLAIAKELSQQGEPARMLDKAARLLLQALLVERVDILTRGDGDEMVPRVDKVRPGSPAGSGQVPRLAARKAGIDHVAVLIDERAAAGGTDGFSRAALGAGSEGPVRPDGAAGSRAEPAGPASSSPSGGPLESPAGISPAPAASGSPALAAVAQAPAASASVASAAAAPALAAPASAAATPAALTPAAPAPAPDPAAPPAVPAPAGPVGGGDTPGSGSRAVPAGTTDSVNIAAGSTDAIRQSTGAAAGHAPHPGDGFSSGTGTAAPSSAVGAPQPPGAAPGPPAAERRGRAICAPLLGMQATVLGLLYVVAEEATLGREELEFVTGFAGVVAVTLENLSLIERARAEAVAQAAYQRQFAPFVADQIAGRDDGIRLDGARCRVALLRCELRGATDLAEQAQPEETSRQLSELFSEAVEVVFEHGGTLERLTGTGLTALWGAPLSSQHDADDAVQAAIGVQRALERLDGEWSRQGRPHLEAAVAIDLGEVFAGNVGGDRRLAFAAIGKPVARAAALCAAAGAGEILVTEALVEALSNPPPIDAIDAIDAIVAVDVVAADPAAAAGPPAAADPAADAEPGAGAGSRAYRIDWHTPPTLRQSAAVSREP